MRIKPENLELSSIDHTPDPPSEPLDNEDYIDVKVGDQIVKMDPTELQRNFKEVVRKYRLDEEDRAEKLTTYIIEHEDITVSEFAAEFKLDVADANSFLAWINIGVQFRKQALMC